MGGKTGFARAKPHFATMTLGVGKIYRINFIEHDDESHENAGKVPLLTRRQLKTPNFFDSLLDNIEQGTSGRFIIPADVAEEMVQQQTPESLEEEMAEVRQMAAGYGGKESDDLAPTVNRGGAVNTALVESLKIHSVPLDDVLNSTAGSDAALVSANENVPDHIINAAGLGTEAGMQFVNKTRGDNPAPLDKSAGVSTKVEAAHPFLNAARSHDIESLVRMVARENIDINMRERKNGGTALHYIALTPAQSANSESTGFKEMDTAVVLSLGTEDLQGNDSAQLCIDAVIELNADVNARATNGSTPLHWAAGAGNASAVERLLDHGADPTVRTYTWGSQVFGRGSGQTAAHWASESGNTDALNIILDAHPHSILFQDEREKVRVDLATVELQADAIVAIEKRKQESYVCVQITLESRGGMML